jgi:proteasome assembly chaperone (PAC2) family protein
VSDATTDGGDIPQLRDPWMVAAFEGWNDAAEAASGVVDHLIDEWDAELLMSLDPEEYYAFAEHHLRPQVGTDEDGDRCIAWPTPRLYVAHPRRSDRDVLLLRAPEPSFRWGAFCSTVVGVAKLAGVTELYTLGALLADSPHTRPVPVTGSATDDAMMKRMSVEPSRYQGPVGIPTILNDVAARQGIATASLWAAVPHYLAEPPCPKATLALLGSLEDASGMTLPQGLLVELAEAWQRGAEDLTDRDSDIAEYVEALEEERETSELPEASGDAIAKEFERYLRRRDDDD